MFNLNSELNWYVILNSTSDCQARDRFFEHGGVDVHPIWEGTPYEQWHDVMPLIAQIHVTHKFLNWIFSTQDDWGILVSSSADVTTVLAHFRSLTQVWVPSGEHAFFRFYDPDFSIRMAGYCDDNQRSQLMGPCHTWLTNNTRVDNAWPVTPTREKEFPWWNVPKNVMDSYTGEDPSTFTMNSLKWLKEHHSDLYFYFSETIITAKVTYLVRRYHQTSKMTINEYLYKELSREVYR